MIKGLNTLEILLKEDLEFEKNAVQTYCEFAERIDNTVIKTMFQNLAEDEAGHAAGLTEILNQITAGNLTINFYCPRCGWTLSVGIGNEVKDHLKCPMCNNVFQVIEKDGDYSLMEVKQ